MDELISLFSKKLNIKSSPESKQYKVGTKRSRTTSSSYNKTKKAKKVHEIKKATKTNKKSVKRTTKKSSPVEKEVQMAETVVTKRGREVKKPVLYKP
jgi:hypothetical protein